ncbi:oxygen-dependent tRNA uridine(34) hydroxylase TrhO [Oscillatoria salina]|uniref:oxygen-dependent tRNA uridine(34) hydroxylase TrhO n=1 Tax=Oscillatoria salina TaxID=331517 RepID=UPI0013B9B6F1|nr:rhodanese-related sulfurtransferase [Oscillatoria salina]MBZ8179595.1 rhodanese-related sulfurtransferase [Oscillatoria salina IIICB1]NET87659.1 rhodanese-related sulfurtransferase [Kamptonema sp. SIO1D9]
MSQVVAAFYKFVRLSDFAELKNRLLPLCQEQGIKGTILLAPEGINGAIAGSRQAIDTVLQYLRSDSRFADLEPQESYTDYQPFERLKVRLKKEIITFGLTEVDPCTKTGTHVTPEEWNALLSDPEVTVIDTRNDYEVNIGTFQGAENPETTSFSDFPDYVRQHLAPSRQKKIAMFCTGGIRCEKASSFLLNQGFQEVYQLQGGILNYLAQVPATESLWEGECFVFDDRVAVKHGLETGSYQLCRSCGNPISQADLNSPYYEEGISCPHCFDNLTEEKRARQQAKQQQIELARKRRSRD